MVRLAVSAGAQPRDGAPRRGIDWRAVLAAPSHRQRLVRPSAARVPRRGMARDESPRQVASPQEATGRARADRAACLGAVEGQSICRGHARRVPGRSKSLLSPRVLLRRRPLLLPDATETRLGGRGSVLRGGGRLGARRGASVVGRVPRFEAGESSTDRERTPETDRFWPRQDGRRPPLGGIFLVRHAGVHGTGNSREKRTRHGRRSVVLRHAPPRAPRRPPAVVHDRPRPVVQTHPVRAAQALVDAVDRRRRARRELFGARPRESTDDARDSRHRGVLRDHRFRHAPTPRPALAAGPQRRPDGKF
mmetsp:Transcript_854/g.2490  ORF Transcript_854/g.2490 Transcript_854/m.2490 type:complete len:306 (-) Transcript_854:290-1207(-)